MPVTVLYPEERQIPDDGLEAEIFGSEIRIMRRQAKTLADLDPADCAEVDGLMIMRYAVTPEDIERFPRLRAIVRMGVGYDRIARPAAAARNILVCNVPDYGTTEVADHAMALALSLRRGVILYHERQRQNPPAAWGPVKGELIGRFGVQTFGIVGLGRIGTAVALRARAFGFRVMFYDPHLPTARNWRSASAGPPVSRICCARPTPCRFTLR
jgi:C-terminal binding protein